MIEFHTAKNGEATVSWGGKSLHSNYNPSGEGEKFAQGVRADFVPLCLIFIEPALAYSLAPLRKRFPRARFVAIRFFEEFLSREHVSRFDGTFFFDGQTELSDELFGFLTEEELCSALVLDWAPAKNVFPQKNDAAWACIKAAILKSRDVLGTRGYFSKRWLKNSLLFFCRVNTVCAAEKTPLPIIVAASGRSLASSLGHLRENRASYFLIAVSSAFFPLAAHRIVPDIVLSTDGGYWAKKHLAFPLPDTDFSSVRFAFSPEAAVPSPLLKSATVIPLCYDDSTIQARFFSALGIRAMPARRNGTVSGTAVELALTLTERNVYCVGLDLAPARGHQHTQPNALELSAQGGDARLAPKETRLSAAQFTSGGSLALYRGWFVAQSRARLKRVKRLSDGYPFESDLGAVEDVGWSFFKNAELGAGKARAGRSAPVRVGRSLAERKSILSGELERIRTTDEFKKELFPMERLSILREADAAKRKELEDELEKKISAFLEGCMARARQERSS